MTSLQMADEISRNFTELSVLTMADSHFRGGHRLHIKACLILLVMSQMSQSTNYMRVFHMPGISCLKLEPRKTSSHNASCHPSDIYGNRYRVLFRFPQRNSCFAGNEITTHKAPYTNMGYHKYQHGLVTAPIINRRVKLLICSQWCSHWSLGMKYFHPALYFACGYLSMLELESTRGSKGVLGY